MPDLDACQQAHVLLVEDNEDHVELTRAALEDSQTHINLHVVADGLSALGFLNREGEYSAMPRPDLVLLDWNLPRVSGGDVLKAIRGNLALAEIPVIVLTTSEAEKDIMKAYRLRANCFLTKPIDFFEFSALMNQINNFWLRSTALAHRGIDHETQTIAFDP